MAGGRQKDAVLTVASGSRALFCHCPPLVRRSLSETWRHLCALTALHWLPKPGVGPHTAPANAPERNMDIRGKRVWQVAAGDTDRNYANLCLRWGVVLNGPGEEGPWPECASRLEENGWSARKISDLRRFADEVEDGNLVVLRLGTSQVFGVGQVVGSYEWCEEFCDVDGWSLGHVRRVRWLWKSQGEPHEFDAYAMKLGDTTQGLTSEAVTRWLSELAVSEEESQSPVPSLPTGDERQNVTPEQLSDFLFSKGVASAAVNALVDQMGELKRIAKWYQHQPPEGWPSEHETVAYLVVPLLRALGWTPQRMAVEWSRIDVALFGRLPRSDDNLRVVVEAKKMDRSCLQAVGQARAYAEGRLQCTRLIVTDGIRYGVYQREEDAPFGLKAYMNLGRLRAAYPIYGECGGAPTALLAMAPEWEV